MRFGTELMRQADVLAQFSEDAPRLTRTYLSAEHKRAGEHLIGLMRSAGMTAGFDALGNIVGRYAAADPDAPLVMTGSHQDSVRNAGKYDGVFGILTAIACVKDLHQRGRRLPYTLEIVGFGDEEGVRFGATLIGSKAMVGSFDPTWLETTDDQGITLRQALTDFGGDPDAWKAVDRRGQRVLAYVESHIEQGPVLLNAGLPVGVVTAIAGCSRLRVQVIGLAGHAGTVPMGNRQDALTARRKWCSSSNAIAGSERARRHVGRSRVPGAINIRSVSSRSTCARGRRLRAEALRRSSLRRHRARRRSVSGTVQQQRRTLRRAIAGASPRRCPTAFRYGICRAVRATTHVPGGGPDRDAVRAMRQQRHQPPSR
jgi:hydantoinase/carbamoylase family amidase